MDGSGSVIVSWWAKLKEMGSSKACTNNFSSLVHLLALMVCLANTGEIWWPESLRGRFDYGTEQAHYVLMALSCEDEWKNYK